MKKNLILFLSIIIFCNTVNGQNKRSKIKVPQKITAAFAAEYPEISAKWENEDGKYEASFVKDNVKTSVLYNAEGIKEETEIAIPITDLPQEAIKYLGNNKMGKIKGAAKIVKANGTIVYEAELKGKDVLFDKEGRFIEIVTD